MSGWHLRLFRRFRVAPGVTVNLSKGGLSTSLGVRGAHVTLGRRGVRQSVGLPGSGLYLVKQTPYHVGRFPRPSGAQTAAGPVHPQQARQMPYHAPLGAHQPPRPQRPAPSFNPVAVAIGGFLRGILLVAIGVAALAVIAALNN